MNCKELRTKAIHTLQLCLLRLKLLPELRRLVYMHTSLMDALEWAPQLTVLDNTYYDDGELWVKIRLDDGWYDPYAWTKKPVWWIRHGTSLNDIRRRCCRLLKTQK